ncbi:hypothetical protein [Aestuariivirga litoralis]|uniref:hypothetical protein n=1 Tax=Aestuariivirga litoralis TaxID=2650924 RepID=UPI0011B4111D|nr:hypothetical protein [Aestuariivirga litoralis]
MIGSKHIELLRRLAKSTKEGKLSWQEDTSKDSFIVAFSRYSVSIAYYADLAGSEDEITVKIFNSEGELIESVSHTDFAQGTLSIGSSFFFLRELYHDARRKAVGIDGALDSILEELPSDDDEVPF